ncbi:MAG: cbb3-type cytochrome c oxidase subunit 3 [Acetobacteraceae bacterium]
MTILTWIEHYSVVAMFVVFALLVAATYWPGRRQEIERHGQMPFEDER